MSRCCWLLVLAWFATTPLSAAAPAPATPLPESAGALFQRLMHATVQNRTDEINQLRERLILDHATSVPARYLAATWGPNDEYRKFLSGILDRRSLDLSGEFLSKFCDAVESGVDHAPPAFLKDNTFALRCAAIARVSGRLRLESRCRAQLSNPSEALGQIAAVVFGGQDAVEQLAAVHAIDDKAAQWFERLYGSRLSEVERQMPRVMRILAEIALAKQEFAEALPWVEKLLAAQPDPQVLFWRGWCRVALGHRAEALADLARLQKDYPRDAWAACGAQIEAAVHTLDQSVAQNSDSLKAVLAQAVRPDTEVLQGTVTFRNKNGEEIAVYVGLQFQRERMEIVTQRAGKTLLAYGVEGNQTRLYFDGDPVVRVYPKAMLSWTPKLHVHADRDGRLSCQFDVQVNSDKQQMPDLKQVLIDSGMVGSPWFAKLSVQRSVANGRVPLPATSDASGTCHVWLGPAVQQPRLDRWECRISSDRSRVSFKGPDLTCDGIEAGPASRVRLAGPAWPNLPSAEQANFDAAMLFRLMGAAASLFTTPEQPARSPVSTARKP